MHTHTHAHVLKGNKTSLGTEAVCVHVWKHCDQDVREKGEREREGRREEQNDFKKEGGSRRMERGR